MQTASVDRSPAEKPKVGELQMDWLRSEDLKEEKNVTTPALIIAVEERIALWRRRAAQRQGVPFGHEPHTS